LVTSFTEIIYINDEPLYGKGEAEMKIAKKVFFDTEFTGLHRGMTLVSLAMVSEDRNSFYAEFTDYDAEGLSPWLEEHVIRNLSFREKEPGVYEKRNGTPTEHYLIRGTRDQVRELALEWLSEEVARMDERLRKEHGILAGNPVDRDLGELGMWGDCAAYDWVLLTDLLATLVDGYPRMPPGMAYIPFDLCTLLELAGVDPDIDRFEFGMVGNLHPKHHALADALSVYYCHKRAENILRGS
jgi:hypothetical protein